MMVPLSWNLAPSCRGDVQPYVLLGLEIHSRGHEVVLATEARMEGLVQQQGKGLLGFHCISGDPTGMLLEKKYQVNGVGGCCKGVASAAFQASS
jgi:hypothetical protein